MLTFVNRDDLIYCFLAVYSSALLNLFESFNYFENKGKNDAQVFPCYLELLTKLIGTLHISSVTPPLTGTSRPLCELPTRGRRG